MLIAYFNSIIKKNDTFGIQATVFIKIKQIEVFFDLDNVLSGKACVFVLFGIEIAHVLYLLLRLSKDMQRVYEPIKFNQKISKTIPAIFSPVLSSIES